MDETKLKDVALINNNSISKNFNFDEIEYIDISSVGTGTLLGTQKILLREAPSRAKRLVNAGDTILSTVRPNRRSFLYFKTSKPNLVASTGFAVLTPTNKIDSRYLYYIINDQKVSDYLTNSAKGAAYPAVDTEIVGNITFKLPSLRTQQKIVSILSAYDDLIENNTRRIKILEEMAQTIYKEWFVNFRFPGHEKVKFVNSTLGKIPEGWQVRKLGDIIELAYGKGLKSDSRIEGEYPVYGSSGVVGSHNEYLVNGPGVVVGRKGNVGSVFYSLKSFFPIDTTFYVKSELKLLYIFYLLSNMSFINNDAAVPGLNRNAALLIQVICPSKNLIKDFSNHVQAIFNLTETLKQKNQNLRKTRDLLLPKLMSGGVPVSALPSKDGEV